MCYYVLHEVTKRVTLDTPTQHPLQTKVKPEGRSKGDHFLNLTSEELMMKNATLIATIAFIASAVGLTAIGATSAAIILVTLVALPALPALMMASLMTSSKTAS
jgi:hypothetical protein